MKRNNLVYAALVVIFALGFFVRLYKLDQIPPSLNWDETAAGYNAWTIFHWGQDEWGNKLPLVFTSFRDDKHPVHIYLTAPFVGVLGLTEFATRIPASIVSSLSILLMFFLAKKIFRSNVAGLFAALFLAVSPYNIHYSRGLWEIDFALFFLLGGLTLFFYGLEKYKLLYPAFLAFGLSLYSYHSSKIVVLPLVVLLLALYFKSLWKVKKHFLLSASIFLLFVAGLIVEPRLLGLARVGQTSFSESLVKSTWIYQKTANYGLARFEIAVKNYPSYFSPLYLFEKGDQNPRGSVKFGGEFYKIDALLLTLGLLALLAGVRKTPGFRVVLVILAWAALAPIPGALTTTLTNSTRAVFMMGSLHLISAFGASKLIEVWKNKGVQITVGVVATAVVAGEFLNFANYYFTKYAAAEAIEWQYGMKEVVKYAQRNPQYYKVYMTSIRQQPYIFFLYYLKTPLPEFLKTAKYDQTLQKSANTVSGYGRFQFGGWDTVESYPNKEILYVVQPSDYVGLRYRMLMDVPLLVKYPNNNEAFFLVTGF